MSFNESNTVEQMILDAATTLGSGAGSSFGPRISRMSTNKTKPENLRGSHSLFVKIRVIRGFNFFLP